MTNELDPIKIAGLLNQSTQQLDKATLSALFDARQNALSRQSVRAPAYAFAAVSSSGATSWTDKLMSHAAPAWAALLLLVVILITGTSYWQNTQELQVDEIDVAILTDVMPIEVFVD